MRKASEIDEAHSRRGRARESKARLWVARQRVKVVSPLSPRLLHR
jgi:hypothetical protein